MAGDRRTPRGRKPRAPGIGDAPMPAVSAAPQNADMLAFLTDAPHMALRAGQVLFTEGDPPNSMYVVRSGTLRIRSGGVIYEDVGAGGIVGEMALVEHCPARSATVYALTDSELVAVDEAHFTTLVTEQAQYALNVLPVRSCRRRRMAPLYRTNRRMVR